MAKVVFARALLPNVMEAFTEAYEIVAPRGEGAFEREELLGHLAGADVFVPTVFDACGADLIKALPESVRLIASFGVGLDHLDLDAAKERTIAVSNTPDVLTDETADLAMGLIIASARRFTETEKWLRDGEWNKVMQFGLYGRRISGKTLGIVGLGRIGEVLARRAKGFDMEVIYFSRSRKHKAERELGVKCAESLDVLLAKSDFVSLNCDLSDETRHIIDAKALGTMKESAFLINTGRGPLVDEQALIKALEEKQIAGAGLDVFEFEPAVPEALLKLPNCTLLPHIGSATHETRTAMGMRVKENVDGFVSFGELVDRVV